jgi:hypothetical protein
LEGEQKGEFGCIRDLMWVNVNTKNIGQHNGEQVNEDEGKNTLFTVQIHQGSLFFMCLILLFLQNEFYFHYEQYKK